MGRLVYLRNVVSLEFSEERCVGCGLCLSVCPHRVFSFNGKKVCITDRDACMECGACAMNCPTNALSVQAGVGCAAAVISSFLGRETSSCCCAAETTEMGRTNPEESNIQTGRSSCC